MKTRPQEESAPPSSTQNAKAKRVHEAEAALAGAAAGAAMGAIAGPPGVVAGAVIGGVVGAVAGAVVEENAVELALADRMLDAEIGVSGGELGAPVLQHPPAKFGAYSDASAGTSPPTDGDPAEGPI